LHQEGAVAAKRQKQHLDELTVSAGGAKSALGGLFQTFGAFLTIDFAINKLQQLDAQLIKQATETDDLSARLDMSKQATQAWDTALQINGTSLSENTAFFERLAKAKQEAMAGDSKAISLLKQFGVEIGNLKNLRMEDIGLSVSKAVQTGDIQRLTAPLLELGGKGAGKLIKTFSSGAIEKSLGLNMGLSDETISSVAFHEDWKKLRERDADGKGAIAAGKGFWRGFIEMVDVIASAPVNAILGKFQGKTLAEGFSHRVDKIGKMHELLNAGKFEEGARTGQFGAEMKAAQESQDATRKKIAVERQAQIDKDKLDEKLNDESFKRLQKTVQTLNKDNKKTDRDEQQIRDDAEREEMRRMSENAQLGKHFVSSAQSAGAFFGNAGLAAGPEVAALNAQIESRDLLREVRDMMKKRKGGLTAEEESF
jgi:hypothetical protein